MSAKAPVFFSIVCLLAPGRAPAQNAPETSLVVITTKAKGGPNLKSQVRKRIEKRLRKDVNVVKFKIYRKAARRAGIKGRAVYDRESAVDAGKEAGVTHVLFVEGQRENLGGKRVYYAELALIEVVSGNVVFTNRYELKGRRITTIIGGEMVEELTSNLLQPPEPPEAIEEPLPEELPPEPPPPPPVEEAPLEEPVAVEPEPAPEAEPVVLEEPPMISALTPTLTEEPPAITLTEPISSRQRKKWRPALHLGVGGSAIQRKAELSAADAKPPGYEGPLPGGSLQLDFYPLAIGGRGEWFEGIGLHGEGHYMRVKTEVDPFTKETVSSDVISANGGLSVRFVFWKSTTAPDFVLKAGYGLFIFPLKKGTFPGTRYAGPYAGGMFTIPFIEELALLMGGHVTPLVTTSGKLKRLGKKNSGLGFRAEGGLRLFFEPFEVKALFRFDQWMTSYTGETNLQNSTNNYTNVDLTDRMFGGFVTAGVAL